GIPAQRRSCLQLTRGGELLRADRQGQSEPLHLSVLCQWQICRQSGRKRGSSCWPTSLERLLEPRSAVSAPGPGALRSSHHGGALRILPLQQVAGQVLGAWQHVSGEHQSRA
ncbi:unnamed protein product, partial [Effrenium voratum]